VGVPLDLTPAAGRAPLSRMLARQTWMELRLTARRGEVVAIALVVPLLALLGAGTTEVIRLPTGDRLGFIVPGCLALAVMSTAFTGLAVTTGYERAYGVLRRLAATALSGSGLLTAKTLAVGVVVAVQLSVLGGVGVLLGWRPAPAGLLPAAGLLGLATAAFAGFGLLLAGTVRPETTAGLANLLYLLLLVGGGLVFPLPAAGAGLELLPTTALATGLRAALSTGDAVPAWCWNDLALWAVVGVSAAARGFRWA
jgi:ABC-2 type transport system permease protein